MRRLVLLALLLGAAAPLAAQPSALPRDLDAYVARTMEAFDVPGLAIAVVQDGRVVLAKGYGVRRLGAPAPVDAHTRFGIASNTKAFTATALGLLVEEGKLAWDAPVVDYLPAFALSDPYVTARLTVRDLLVHRSGLSPRRRAICSGGPPPRTRAPRSPIACAISHSPGASATATPTTTCSTSWRANSSRP